MALDGTGYRPKHERARGGDHPLDADLLQADRSNLVYLYKNRGERCSYTLDADAHIQQRKRDDLNQSDPKQAGRRFAHRYVQSDAGRFNAWAAVLVIPYFIHPSLKSVTLTLFYRVSRDDVDEGTETGDFFVYGGLREVPFRYSDANPLATNKFNANIHKNSNDNPRSFWTYDSITLDFTEDTRDLVSPRRSWLSFEIRSPQDQADQAAVFGSVTGPANRELDPHEALVPGVDEFEHTEQFIENRGTGGSTDLQGRDAFQEGNVVDVRDLGNRVAAILERPSGLTGPGDIDQDYSETFQTFLEVRSFSLTSTYYEPRAPEKGDALAKSPPASQRIKSWPQIVNELRQRRQLVGLFEHERVTTNDTYSTIRNEHVRAAHEPATLYVYLCMIHIYLDSVDITDSDDWSDVGDKSPEADSDIQVEVRHANGSVINTVSSTSGETYYGVTTKGFLPFLFRQNYFNSSRFRREGYLDFDTGDDLGEGESNIDQRVIAVDVSGSDYDHRKPLDVKVESKLKNKAFPEGGLSSGKVFHDYVLGGSIWVEPKT